MVVVVAGILLRLDGLTSSLWLDEFGTFWVVEGNFVTMLERAWVFQGQSPLYYAFPWMSRQVFGDSELALRLPSLLFGCLSVIAVYSSAGAMGGPTAGLYAAALFWLSVPAVQYTVDARPYSLVMFTVAVALAGFSYAVRFGTRRARLAWIVGGAAVAWSHYLHYPLVLGLYVAYAVLPALRSRYSMRRFAIDGMAQFALVSLCAPQILALMARRGTLSWISDFNYAVLLEPIWPLLIGIVVGVAQLARRGDATVEAVLRRALLICAAVQLTVIAGASLAGMNLLSGRYVTSVLIPAVVFVATALARAKAESVIATVSVFAIATGAVFASTKESRGSFSGNGFQDWRTAVDDLSARIGHEGKALVLFRSGFVEEDLIPLGSPPPAVFAPLRSPGRAPFATTVVPLNFRWAHPLRDTYFNTVIAPKADEASVFFVIGARGDATVGSYMTKVVEWMHSRWPGRHRVRRTPYGGVELIEFLSTLSTEAIPADKVR